MYSISRTKLNTIVIGGGDGGVLRELVKHPSVEQITLCEIDGDVIEVSKKYLPSLSIGFSNPKVTVFVGDGGTPYLYIIYVY